MNIINNIGKYMQPGRSWFRRSASAVTKITVHHTASTFEGTDAQELTHAARAHFSNGWPGLAYHFFITRNGNIYQLNSFSEVTWHDAVNWDSIGIALQGHFHPIVGQQVTQMPTQEQLRALKGLLDELTGNRDEIPAGKADVYGHRERSSTACPGDLFFPKIKEYREKNGNVSWGGSVIPAPSPIMDSRPFWFDLINKSVWNKGWEQLKENDIRQFSEVDYPSRAKRAGLWDQITGMAQMAGDTTKMTAQQVFDKVQSLVDNGSYKAKYEQEVKEHISTKEAFKIYKDEQQVVVRDAVKAETTRIKREIISLAERL